MKKVLALALALGLVSSPALAQQPSEIAIVPGSTINMVAREARIPITIENASDALATVTLKGVATSFRIEVVEFVETEVPANTSVVVELPVRAIANGPVQLKLWLVQDGKMLNDFVFVDVNVNYDVELFLLVSFAVVLLVLITVGGIRTARKLRRGKA